MADQGESASLLAQTRTLLHRLGLRPKKSLGQHFLIDETALQRIVAAAELRPNDVVIEVGPGLGVLTRELARRAGRVIGVEMDDKLAAALIQELKGNPKVAVVHEDVLKTSPAELLARARLDAGTPYKVVANLPYYVTSMVLRHFLEAFAKPQRIVVTIQKEVAENITAKPGDLSLLAVSVQFYGQPFVMGVIPARSFYPAPEVDSAILRIDLYLEPPVKVPSVERFFEVVRAGFASRRKQLHNALAQNLWLPPGEAPKLLERAGIDPKRRAETLTLEEWARLSWALEELRSQKDGQQ